MRPLNTQSCGVHQSVISGFCRAEPVSHKPVQPSKSWCSAALVWLLLSSATVAATEIQAHRGARGLFPENTLAAFGGSLRIGVDVLELDTGLSRDSVVMVSHDPKLNPSLTRDSAGRWIKESVALQALSADQLQAFDVGRLRPDSRGARRFPTQQSVEGERMPRLAQVFELVRKADADDVEFNIEIKLRPGGGPVFASPQKMAAAVAAQIRKADVVQRTTVQGFDWRALVALRKIAPDIRLAALTVEQSWLDNLQRGEPGASAWTASLDIDEHGGSTPHLVKALGAEVWSPYWREIDASSLRLAHQLGLVVSVWTVNNKKDMRTMLELGVDSIITDYPDRLREVMQNMGMPVPDPVR